MMSEPSGVTPEKAAEWAALAAAREAVSALLAERERSAWKLGIIEGILSEIERGDHATAGRDFGRGMAQAAKLIRAALTGTDTDHG